MIYQFSPFLNENLIASIAAKESSKYGGIIYITESNRNFHYCLKESNYKSDGSNNIIYDFLNVDDLFVPNDLVGKIKLFPYRLKWNSYEKNILKSPTWYNEAVQRNLAAKKENLKINDNDIIILCDIDEIIDSNKIEIIIDGVKKYGIVTGKLYFTLFYFNLYSKNWAGAKDYSYRLFAMSGKYFKNMPYSSDELRKRGENDELKDKIHLINEFIGFHHSWIGDEKFIQNKINSYAHVNEHQGLNSVDYIRNCLKNHESIFPGHILEMNEKIKLLDSVNELKNTKVLENFFL